MVGNKKVKMSVFVLWLWGQTAHADLPKLPEVIGCQNTAHGRPVHVPKFSDWQRRCELKIEKSLSTADGSLKEKTLRLRIVDPINPHTTITVTKTSGDIKCDDRAIRLMRSCLPVEIPSNCILIVDMQLSRVAASVIPLPNVFGKRHEPATKTKWF